MLCVWRLWIRLLAHKERESSMFRKSPFEVSEKPLAIPKKYQQGALLADYVALLQKLHDTRLELKEEQSRRISAEEHAWAFIAGFLYKAELELRRAAKEEEKSQIPAKTFWFLEQLDNMWKEQDIVFKEATGKIFTHLPSGEFEILSSRAPTLKEEEGIVVETWQPAIYRRGRLITGGQVIVTRGENTLLEESE